jgi:hypothetical protein
MSNERQRLTQVKFRELLDGLKEKIGDDEIENLLKRTQLNEVAISNGSRNGFGIGHIGPFYSGQETFDQMDFIVAYYAYDKKNVSKNEIFRILVEDRYKEIRKEMSKSDKKTISRIAIEIKQEREEKKKAKQKAKLLKKEQKNKRTEN